MISEILSESVYQTRVPHFLFLVIFIHFNLDDEYVLLPFGVLDFVFSFARYEDHSKH